MIEDTDYALVPTDETQEDSHWNVRFMTGQFSETVITYGAVSIDEDNESLNFNFSIVYSPMPDLTLDDVDLQLAAGDMLSAILADATTAARNKSE
jgi:hypothetical protein|tara:strand:- start:79 stop:363 length:285 start_codon:yes stop_codon:yes gene_type:complete